MARLQCLVLALVLWCGVSVHCVPLEDFYPFGEDVGDAKLSSGDDISNSAGELNPGFPFLGSEITSLFVSSNGLISFGQSDTSFIPRQFPFSAAFSIICPFWSDVNLRRGGAVYYSLNGSTSSAAYTKSREDIQELFGVNFNPTVIFISTWKQVPRYGGSSHINNTFQCVLMSDDIDSFIMFLYADGGIQWLESFHQDYPQIGINAGDNSGYYSVPGSLTPDVRNIVTGSNVGRPGLWVFKVDTDITVGPPGGAPENLRVTDIRSTSVRIEWGTPSNGSADNFTVTCSPHSVTMTTTSTSVTLEPLEEYTVYSCYVTAVNIFGAGPHSDNISIATLEAESGGINLTAVGSAGGAGLLIAVLIAIVLTVTCIFIRRKHKRERARDEHIYTDPDQSQPTKFKHLPQSKSSHHYVNPKARVAPKSTVWKKCMKPQSASSHYMSLLSQANRESQHYMSPNDATRLDRGEHVIERENQHYMLLNDATRLDRGEHEIHRENQHYMPLSDATRLDRGEHVMVSTQEQTVHYQNTSGHKCSKGSGTTYGGYKNLPLRM